MKPILIISHDIVGPQMAGPGIRYYHLARTLSRTFPVVLAVPQSTPVSLPNVSLEIAPYERRNWESMKPWADRASVVIFPSDIANEFPQLGQIQVPLVIDGYDPLLAEWLFMHQAYPLQDQEAGWRERMRHLGGQYLMGDFFLCASERQRDWWLGLLEAHGRINPQTLADDRSLRSLIDVVPFGLPETPLQYTRQTIKSIWPGIGASDKVILWGGGLWSWLDPLTAIRAVAKVRTLRPDIRLVFPGTRHPNPMLAGMATHNEAAVRLAEDLDLLNKMVFFGDWISYSDWGNVLMESDLALSLHYDTLETRLAFRSRILEYIWRGLPIVATRGDATAEIIERYGLGTIVDYEDVDAVAEAMVNLLETPPERYKESFESARQDLTWEKAAQPLIAFCRNPHFARDRQTAQHRVGSPFYISQIDELGHTIETLKSRVNLYEQNPVVKMMRWINKVRWKLVKSMIDSRGPRHQEQSELTVIKEHREKTARWLRGKGIEIGAFKTPIEGISPIYVDKFQEYANEKCQLDVLCEPDALPFPSNSLDYVASTHVLEHMANPVASICEWYRVLRPGGIIYMVVPDRRFTWDRKRALTTSNHLLEDYANRVTDCDSSHVDDFVENIVWSEFDASIAPEKVPDHQETMKQKYHSAVKAGEIINIHFHVFEPVNVLELFKRLSEDPATQLKLTILDQEEQFPSNAPNGFLIVARVDKKAEALR